MEEKISVYATIIHYNGYSLNELAGGSGKFGDWEHVCWGDPSRGLMGRIPTAIQHALLTKSDHFIWSTGSTRLPSGEFEAEHAMRIALERADQFSSDFPAHFEGLIPVASEFEAWIKGISYCDCESTNTSTSMECIVPELDKVLDGRPGAIYTVTSANHISRALRDAVSVWQHGYIIEEFECSDGEEPKVKKRRVKQLADPWNVSICGIAAATSWGNGSPTETRVDDLGNFLTPR